jgi:hypothetical protein
MRQVVRRHFEPVDTLNQFFKKEMCASFCRSADASRQRKSPEQAWERNV